MALAQQLTDDVMINSKVVQKLRARQLKIVRPSGSGQPVCLSTAANSAATSRCASLSGAMPQPASAAASRRAPLGEGKEEVRGQVELTAGSPSAAQVPARPNDVDPVLASGGLLYSAANEYNHMAAPKWWSTVGANVLSMLLCCFRL